MDSVEASNQVLLSVLLTPVAVILGAMFIQRSGLIRVIISHPIVLVIILSIMLLIMTGGVHI